MKPRPVPRLVEPPSLNDGHTPPPPPPKSEQYDFWDDPPPRVAFETVFGLLSVIALGSLLMVVLSFLFWMFR